MKLNNKGLSLPLMIGMICFLVFMLIISSVIAINSGIFETDKSPLDENFINLRYNIDNS